MNRVLKFRAWDNLLKMFIYPDGGYQGHYILTLDGRFQNLQNGSGGSEYYVQQYIGLKDKNGKEIYEGDYINFSCNWTVCLGDKDIVEYKNQYVHYDSTIASYVFGHREEFTILDKIMLQTLEVIGNEFENPELIGQER
jgi:hypothetical protein